RVVQHRVDAVADDRREDAREPGGEEIARGGADALVGLREPEVIAFVRSGPLLERLVRGRNVLDAHPLSDFAPEIVVAELLVAARLPPAERVNPVNRLK